MESIIARALEYTLKYWLKSFSRDQFKLQGRTAQLSSLDINGDALHASIGLPPALEVSSARVGKLQITLPSFSNVQVEPIVVQIDKLDVALKENDSENLKSPTSTSSSASAPKNNGYGFSEKIADGMTVEVGIVNLLLETRGACQHQGVATWSPPLAAITIRNLVLYTTNENWKVVNLKEARDFSNDRGYIYVFKKLEWESLSVDLLPHPDMFTDLRFNSSNSQNNNRDDDGAKRIFFGGERFLEGISGDANITVQKTEQNSPVGLEIQLHVSEAVVPALSEPGLRAFLRFMTGLSACLSRGDVDPRAQQNGSEAAGSSLVSILVDHIFLCVKDAEFQLELLMQSLFFSRASVSERGKTRNLSCLKVGGLFVRDTFSRPVCTLIQPSMKAYPQKSSPIPEFGQNFCPPIYPFGNQSLQVDSGEPLLSLYSLQITPSPSPPKFASQTFITCQPLMITLQENSCLRIASFLADGVVTNASPVLLDFSVNSLVLALREFDLAVPLDAKEVASCSDSSKNGPISSFSAARLLVEDLYLCQSPSAKCTLLNLEKDPACFSLWEYQPIDASQRKWVTGAAHITISLEAYSEPKKMKLGTGSPAYLWKCVELHDVRFEAAMATADGSPLLDVPPPDGVVRIGVAYEQLISNSSVEQLFFVLDLYTYFGQVGERISKVSKRDKHGAPTHGKNSEQQMNKKLPSDTAVSLVVKDMQLNFLEPSKDNQGTPLVQFAGDELLLKVSHRTLGGAFAVSTDLQWKEVLVSCLDGEGFSRENGVEVNGGHDFLLTENGPYKMRPIFWVDNESKYQAKPSQFLEISIVNVLPNNSQDTGCHSLNVSAKISGVRLGGGISYTESLLHRFGILGPDGGPGEGLMKGLKELSSGPLARLFKSSAICDKHDENSKEELHDVKFDMGLPEDINVSIELKNWLFALEGADIVWSPRVGDITVREEKCWHTTFRSLQLLGKSNEKSNSGSLRNSNKNKIFPVEFFTARVEGLQAIKPCFREKRLSDASGMQTAHKETSNKETVGGNEGIDVEATVVVLGEDSDSANWTVENVKFSVKQPIEAVATKDELQNFAVLCRTEVDSMGRITAGILRLLKLDKSFGKTVINQLSNLGSDSLDRIMTPGKLSRKSSFGSLPSTPVPATPTSNAIREGSKEIIEATVALLESELLESQNRCSNLVSATNASEDCEHTADIQELSQKLESMHILLARLRTLL